ncbi:hypothetical protein KCU92_g5754, partial [Aureobasidium melanogenum]|jgi:hypothetical protein
MLELLERNINVASGPSFGTLRRSNLRQFKDTVKALFEEQYLIIESRPIESRHHLFLDDRPSYWPMVYGTDVGHGTNNLSISQAVTNIPVKEEVFIWINQVWLEWLEALQKIVADSGLDRDQIVQLAQEDLGIALEKARADSINTLDDRKAANARSRKLQSSVRILRTQNPLAGSSAPSSQPSSTPKAKARRTLQRSKHQQQTKPLSDEYVDEDDDMDDVDTLNTADLDNVATQYEDHESMDDLDDLDEWQDHRSGGYR